MNTSTGHSATTSIEDGDQTMTTSTATGTAATTHDPTDARPGGAPGASGTAYQGPEPTGPGLSFARLFQAELRKTVDTRAGRWLLVVIVALTVLAMGLVMWFGRESGAAYATLLATAVTPQAVLLPVLGILTAASEWSQRTALVTFTQEPRRMRVMAAKALAAVALGLVVVAITFVLAALAHVISASIAGGDIDLGVPGHVYLGAVMLQVIYVLMGVGFGALFLNVPLAIAGFFVLPVIMNLLAATVTWISERAAWIDQTIAQMPFMAVDAAPTGEQWAQLGVTSIWWVLIPLAVGLWRVARREVK
ncbi:hypothetical protein [Serinicoccus marinus]|uniref:hypothetical protein n=1 Tax=Serinicoccus marinus TaxID=247333 RepID=UPI0003B3223C|nr:hypothetical protein [Serinicoccus marinus]